MADTRTPVMRGARWSRVLHYVTDGPVTYPGLIRSIQKTNLLVTLQTYLLPVRSVVRDTEEEVSRSESAKLGLFLAS
jgi:hypothetical protein